MAVMKDRCALVRAGRSGVPVNHSL